MHRGYDRYAAGNRVKAVYAKDGVSYIADGTLVQTLKSTDGREQSLPSLTAGT